MLTSRLFRLMQLSRYNMETKIDYFSLFWLPVPDVKSFLSPVSKLKFHFSFNDLHFDFSKKKSYSTFYALHNYSPTIVSRCFVLWEILRTLMDCLFCPMRHFHWNNMHKPMSSCKISMKHLLNFMETYILSGSFYAWVHHNF